MQERIEKAKTENEGFEMANKKEDSDEKQQSFPKESYDR